VGELSVRLVLLALEVEGQLRLQVQAFLLISKVLGHVSPGDEVHHARVAVLPPRLLQFEVQEQIQLSG